MQWGDTWELIVIKPLRIFDVYFCELRGCTNNVGEDKYRYFIWSRSKS